MRNLHRIAALCAAAVGPAMAAPPPAHAASVFFGFGPPVYYAPPAYYPPPLYYPPPPAYYPPPPPQYYTPPPPPYAPPPRQTSAATTCYAGAFVCPMESQVSIGTTCWCPNNAGGRTYGRAG